MPQLFEAGFEDLFDRIIYITADKSIRKERLIKRNSFTPEEAENRINAQTESGKKEKSDLVIENNGEIKDLNCSINNVLKKLNLLDCL